MKKIKTSSLKKKEENKMRGEKNEEKQIKLRVSDSLLNTSVYEDLMIFIQSKKSNGYSKIKIIEVSIIDHIYNINLLYTFEIKN
jgi:hypothetical protein